MSKADVQYDPKLIRKALNARRDETTLDAAMRARETVMSRYVILAWLPQGGFFGDPVADVKTVEPVGPFLTKHAAEEWAKAFIDDKGLWIVVKMTDSEEYEKEVRG